MKTTASNRKLRQLLVAIRTKTLIPDPDFQRRLVWTNKDKRLFLDTVLNGYPFPEIYIAAGEVDPQTGEGTELLVDGQQRLTTLYQYFVGARELRLGGEITAYKNLPKEEQIKLLEYDVVVRDLGNTEISEIKEIFKRINATSYSLNAMEIRNSRFNGELKKFAQEVSESSFFNNHNIFSANEIRRMRDVSYCLSIIITMMSTYFNREDEFESFLSTYNDDFEEKEQLRKNMGDVFRFIDKCTFDEHSRVWKNSDLFTLLIELYNLMFREAKTLGEVKIGEVLKSFYDDVDRFTKGERNENAFTNFNIIAAYSRAASQATNDRGSRIRRGEIVHDLLETCEV